MRFDANPRASFRVRPIEKTIVVLLLPFLLLALNLLLRIMGEMVKIGTDVAMAATGTAEKLFAPVFARARAICPCWCRLYAEMHLLVSLGVILRRNVPSLWKKRGTVYV